MDSPFVGPRPFDQTNIIYGRDQEIAELRYYAGAKRIVLLYSPSGAGKSSLLNAGNGLLAKLRQTGRFDVLGPARVNQAPDGFETGNRFAWSAINEFEKRRTEGARPPQFFAQTTLAEYVRERAKTKNVFLVFDQFEEVLRIDPKDTSTKRALFDQLGELLFDPQVWALFVIREDYLASLDPYARQLPTHLLNRFRVDFLRREDQALDAVTKPLKATGRAFESGVAEDVLKDLALGGDYVEPLQLQVVCSNLWDKIASRDPQQLITRTDVGEISDALATYYRQKVHQADPGREREIRDWFDEKLITADGVRNLVRQEARESAGLPNEVAEELVNTYLVRKESRAGGMWLELAHDRLVEPVRRDNKKWREENLSPWQRAADLWDERKRPTDLLLRGESLQKAQEWSRNRKLTSFETEFFDQSQAAEAAALKAQQAAERELRQARRTKILGYVVSILGVGAIIASYFAYAKSREALENARLATENAALASKNEATAIENEKKAQKKTKEAEVNERKFETAAKQATEQSARADTEARAARSALAKKDAAEADRMLIGNPRQDIAAAYAAHALRTFPESVEARATTARLLLGRPWHMPGPLLRHRGLVHAAFSADGNLVATSGADGTRIWNSANGRSVATLPLAGGASYAEFRPDGKFLLTVSQDGAILWDTSTWKRAGEPFRTSRGITSAASFSPDNRRIAVGAGVVIELFDIATRAPSGGTMTLQPVSTLKFSPDNRHLLAKASGPGGAILDTATGETSNLPLATDFAFNFNGALALANGNRGVGFFGPKGEALTLLYEGRGSGLAFVGGTLLAIAGENGVTFHNHLNGKPIREPVLAKSMPSTLRTNGNSILVLTGIPSAVSVLSLGPEASIAIGNPLLHEAVNGALSPRIAQALTWGIDGIARLWNPVPGSDRVEEVSMPSSALSPAALIGDSLVYADLLEAAGTWYIDGTGDLRTMDEAERAKRIASLRQRLPTFDRVAAADVRRFLR